MMETIRKTKPTLNGKQAHHFEQMKAELGHAKAHAEEATHVAGDVMSQWWDEGKKIANGLYEDGLRHINSTEQEIEQYADQMAAKIKKSPLKSVLIAGGVGFLLASLLKK